MAKKVEFKLDDFMTDSSLELSDADFGMGPPVKDDRSPVTKVAVGVGQGLKSKLSDETFIRNAVYRTLPKGFGSAMDIGFDTRDTIKDVYQATANEMRPFIRELKKTTEKLVPYADKVAPKLARKMEKFAKQEESYSYRMMDAGEYREAKNQEEIAEIFALSSQAQAQRDEEAAIREQIRDGIDMSRHKDSMQQLNTIRLGIQQLVNYQNKINVNYQRKTLELNFRTYGVLADMLTESRKHNVDMLRRMDSVVKNTGLPDYVKLQNSERLGEAMRSQIFNSLTTGLLSHRRDFVKGLGQRMAQGARNKVSEMTQLFGIGLASVNDSLDRAKMESMYGDQADQYIKAGKTAGGVLADFSLRGGRFVRDRLTRNARVRGLSNKLQFTAENIPQMFNEWLQSNDRPLWMDTMGITGAAQNMLRRGRQKGAVDVDSIRNTNQPMPFNRLAHKSVVEVIPGLLSRIHQELKIIRTGDANAELTTYDFASNKFADASKAKSNMFNSLIKRDREFTQGRIDSILKEIDPDDTLDPAAKAELGKQLLRGNLDDRLSSKESLTNMRRYRGASTQQAGQYAKLFRRYFKTDHDGERQLRLSKEIGSLGAGGSIEDARANIQRLINLGYGGMLEEAGIKIDRRGNIEDNRYYDFLSGEAAPNFSGEQAGGGVSGQGFRNVVQQAPATSSSREKCCDHTDIIQALRESAMASTNVLAGLLNQVSEQLAAGIPTVATVVPSGAAPESSDGNTPSSGGGTSTTGSPGSDYVRRRSKFGKVTDLVKNAFKFGKKGTMFAFKQSNSIVDQSFGTAWKLFKPAAKLAGKLGVKGGGVGLRALPSLAKGAFKASNFIGDGIFQGARNALGLGRWGLSTVAGTFMQDVYVQGEDRPRLRASIFKSGGYTSARTGKVLKGPDDIDGPVMYDGQEVLSAEDIQNGLVDAKGNSITSAGLRAIGAGFGLAGKAAKLGFKGANFLAGGINDGISNAMGLAKGGLGSLFGGLTLGNKKTNSILTEIRDILDMRLPGKKNKFDFSGDGIVDGSFEAIRKQREAEKAGKEGAQQGPQGPASSAGFMGMLASLFGKKDQQQQEGGGDGDNVFIGGGGAEGKDKKPGAKKPAPKGFWGKTKSLLGKGARGLGALATGALGLLGVPTGLVTGAAGLAGKAAVGTGKLGWGAAKLLGRGALGLVSLLGLPVTLGIAATAAAGYGIYKLATRKKLTAINKIRFAQYGFVPAEEDKAKNAVFGLEDMLNKKVVFKEGIPEIDMNEINPTELMEPFGISPKDGGASEKFVNWFVKRFKPVYLTNRGVLKKIAGKDNLEDVESLDKEVQLQFIDGASFPGGPYDEMVSPFPDDKSLSATARTVDEFVKAAKAEITKSTSDKVKDAVVGSAAAATVAAGAVPKSEAEAKAQTSEGQSAKPRITPLTVTQEVMAKNAVGAGGATATVAGAIPDGAGTSGKLSAQKAVRYKTYGLLDMEYRVVKLIDLLEIDILKGVTFDAKKTANYVVDFTVVGNKWCPAFGISDPTSEEGEEWLKWFNLRFLPVFMNYLSYLKKVTDKEEPMDAERGLTAAQQLELATTVSTTMSAVGGGLSVWKIYRVFYPGYPVNVNPDSVNEQLEFLKKAMTSAKLPVEGTKDSGVPTDKKVFDPANPKPGDPQGFVDGAGGAAFGVYNRKGRMQTSPGSAGVPVSQGGAGVPSNTFDPNDTRPAWRIIRDKQDAERQQRLMGEAQGGSGGPSEIGGGNAAGAISDGTGGQYQSLPDPKGSGNAAALQDLIHAAAEMAGVDPNLMMTMAAIESGFRHDVKASTSSATGLYQFIKTTWEATVKKYGAKYGISMNTPPTDPKANALMGGEFLKENMRALQGVVKGRAITDTDLYLAHFLGAGGAKKFLSADPNAIAANDMGPQARANKRIFYNGERPRTYAEVYAVLNALVRRKGKEFGLNAGNGPVAKTATAGAQTSANAAQPSTPTDAGFQGGEGGYASSTKESRAVVDQTPNGVQANATSLRASQPGVPDASGSSAQSPATSGTPSQTASPSGLMTRQQASDTLAAQQKVNAENNTAGLGQTNDILNKQFDVQVKIAATLTDMFDYMKKRQSDTEAASRNVPPANSNSTVTSNDRRTQGNRPASDVPVSMSRRYAT